MLAEAAPPRDIADALAELKARRVAGRAPERLVLGADQVLVCDGRLFDKPRRPRRGPARSCWPCAAGSHELLSAAVVFEAGRAGLAARRPGAAARCGRSATPSSTPICAREGDGAARRPSAPTGSRTAGRSSSAGCEGDFFTIMGLPLLELLGFLRSRGICARMSARAAPRRGDRLADRPFALAAAARALAAPLRHRRLLRSDRAAARSASTPACGRCRALGFRGVNVTIPHKEAALALAATASPRAAAIGAANTLTFGAGRRDPRRQHRRLRLLANLRQEAPGWSAATGPALVLGAGGAARAIVEALLDEGAPEVRLANRTRARAEVLRGALRPAGRGGRLVGGGRRARPGRRPSSTPPRSAWRRAPSCRSGSSGSMRAALVADIVYGAEPTPLRAPRRGSAA